MSAEVSIVRPMYSYEGLKNTVNSLYNNFDEVDAQIKSRPEKLHASNKAEHFLPHKVSRAYLKTAEKLFNEKRKAATAPVSAKRVETPSPATATVMKAASAPIVAAGAKEPTKFLGDDTFIFVVDKHLEKEDIKDDWELI